MKIWQILEWCATGAYVGGEVFKNQLGQEIYFDGQMIKGLKDINPLDEWKYVESNKKPSSSWRYETTK